MADYKRWSAPKRSSFGKETLDRMESLMGQVKLVGDELLKSAQVSV